MNGYGRNRTVRYLLIGIPAAVVLVVLVVCGFWQLHHKAVEREKLAQAYAEQLGAGANHSNEGTNSKDNSNLKDNSNVNDNTGGSPNHNDGSDANGSNANSPGGSGVNFVGTENTPEPVTSPTTNPPVTPSPLPSPSPEPTTNGHEFDNEMVIAVDAGHGGYDGGSVVGDIIEKDINLAVAQEIARLLEEHGGITVVQTRASDEHLSLQERSNIGNEAKCDYFVSVHCNTYEQDSSVHGLECYYYEKSDEGKKFAQGVLDDLKQYKDMKIRSTKADTLAVTRHTYCPAILIEMGFLTNPTDKANLADAEYQKKIAKRITDAVLKTIGL